MADEDVATSAAAKGASAEEEGSAAVLEPAAEQEPAAVPETAAAPTQEAILSFVADLISRTPIENLTVKEIVGELKNGPLRAESGGRHRPCARITRLPCWRIRPAGPSLRPSARRLADGDWSGLSHARSPVRWATRAGRDYSKPWLREEIDRLVSEAETAQEQAASQGDWAPGTVA